MRIDILTLFPEMFTGVLASSILKRAQDKKIVSYHLHQLRDFTNDPHKKVDDRPFGGGPGMVLMCQPVIDAVNAIEGLEDAAGQAATRILLAPTGEKFSQAIAAELSGLPRLLLIAGHYEGFDERIHELLQPREISIGDYILSGGELPAMVLLDAVVRLIPGVLGDDALAPRRIVRPRRTRPSPADWNIRSTRGRGNFRGTPCRISCSPATTAPSKNGAREQARKRTAERRPDLLERK